MRHATRFAAGAPPYYNTLTRTWSSGRRYRSDSLAPDLRAAVREIDPGLPIVRMRTADEVFEEAAARPGSSTRSSALES
jgi:hypothetical protein